MNLLQSAIYIILIISVLPAFLTGCMVGPDFKRPVMDLPDKYRFSEEKSAEIVNLRWWELFNDPILQSLVNTALEENKDIRIAIARIEQARASLGFTRADMYPFIDIEAGANKGTFSGGRRSETTDYTAFAAPIVSWELDIWGKLRRPTGSN